MSTEKLLYHAACECGSSDALAVYEDGGKHCFSCGYHAFGDSDVPLNRVIKMPKDFEPIEGRVKAIPSRGINDDTCKFWNYQAGIAWNPSSKIEEFCHIANFYDDRRNLVGQKIRFQDKSFLSLGDTNGLYGKHLWNKSKFITITEGEIDALSISQVNSNKWPVVSIPHGAQAAAKVIKENLRWLEDNFDNVVLSFDNDDAGRKATKEVLPLFSPGKALVANLSEKDANECLLKGKVQELVSISWMAKSHRPDGIVNAAEVEIDDIPQVGLSFPWEHLSEMLCGFQKGSYTLFTSGTGSGKTEVIKAIAANLLSKHKQQACMILLEEKVKKTKVKIAGKLVGKRFDSPTIKFDFKERDKAVAILDESRLLWLYDSFGLKDFDTIASVIRHLAIAEGVEYFFIDHITAFTDGKEDSNGEGERLSSTLSSLVTELDIGIIAIVHLRKTSNTQRSAEEGGVISLDDMKGTGGIKQWAHNVVAVEKISAEEEDNNYRRIKLLKSREFGENVGKKFYLRYYEDTGNLKEVEKEEAEGT